MSRPSKLDIRFIVLSVLAFIVLCIGTAYSMIAVIGWYLLNCKYESAKCSAVLGLIDYWWIVFVPAVLVSTYFLRRAYDRRQIRDAGTD